MIKPTLQIVFINSSLDLTLMSSSLRFTPINRGKMVKIMRCTTNWSREFQCSSHWFKLKFKGFSRFFQGHLWSFQGPYDWSKSSNNSLNKMHAQTLTTFQGQVKCSMVKYSWKRRRKAWKNNEIFQKMTKTEGTRLIGNQPGKIQGFFKVWRRKHLFFKESQALAKNFQNSRN